LRLNSINAITVNVTNKEISISTFISKTILTNEGNLNKKVKLKFSNIIDKGAAFDTLIISFVIVKTIILSGSFNTDVKKIELINS